MNNNEEEEKEETIFFSTRIKASVIEEFKRYCRKNRLTISGQVELMMEDFLHKARDPLNKLPEEWRAAIEAYEKNKK